MPTSVPVYTLFYFVITKCILSSLYFIHKGVNLFALLSTAFFVDNFCSCEAVCMLSFHEVTLMISSCSPYIHFIFILSTYVLLLFSLAAILILFYETYNYYKRVFFLNVITILITVYNYFAILTCLSGNYLSCSQRLKY